MWWGEKVQVQSQTFVSSPTRTRSCNLIRRDPMNSIKCFQFRLVIPSSCSLPSLAQKKNCTPFQMSQGKTIRFEDLGEPVQRLLRSVKGDNVSDEDMALLEYVSVKDMAKIYSEMSSERQAEVIWQELRNALLARREKAEAKKRELAEREKQLASENSAMEVKRVEDEEAARQESAEEEERRRRREERRKRRAQEAAASEAAEAEASRAAQEEAEAAEAAAAEEAERQRKEDKRRRREAKQRALQEEQEAIRAEQEREDAKRRKNQKRDWEDYVKSHPLEFHLGTDAQVIEQVRVAHELKAPPRATDDLLNRMYTPKCPNCNAKFSKPPKDWDCPMCLRRYRQRIKTWQPDDQPNCMMCNSSVGRFSRHHCRNCGRVVCANCSPGQARIPGLGFDEPTRVCTQCLDALAKAPPEAAATATAPQDAKAGL